MAQVTRRFRLLMGDLRRQAYFRSGDEKTILLGWSDGLERQINRLETGGMSPADTALAIEALRHMRNEAEGDLDDIMSSKAPPHVSEAECDAARVRYAARVADAPWNLPSLVKPKGQWGGKRETKS